MIKSYCKQTISFTLSTTLVIIPQKLSTNYNTRLSNIMVKTVKCLSP